MTAKQTGVSLPEHGAGRADAVQIAINGNGSKKQHPPEQRPEKLMTAKQTGVSLPEHGAGRADAVLE